MEPRPPFRLGFRVSITLVLVTAVVLMAAVTIGMVVAVGGSAAAANAQARFLRIASTVGERIDDLLKSPVVLARQAAADPRAAEPVAGDGLGHPFLGVLEGALASSVSFYSVYVGHDDGQFLQLIRAAGDPRILSAQKAPEGTQYLLRTITGAGAARTERWTFLGAGRQVLGRRTQVRPDYHPEVRPWYSASRGAADAVLSEPYVFQSLGEPGVTASRALAGGKAVLGVDLSLVELQDLVDSQSVSASGGILVQGAGGSVLAQTKGFVPQPRWLSVSVPRTVGGRTLTIVLGAPLSDFDAEFRTLQFAVVLTTLGLLVLLVPLTLLFTNRLTRIMGTLIDDVDRVCRMDFAGQPPRGSRVREFDRLAKGFTTMKGALARETTVLAQAKLKLSKIVETGIALSTEKDSNALCQKILDTAMDLTDADGGTLYLLDDDRRSLKFNIMVTESLGRRNGGTSGQPIPGFLAAGVPLYRPDGAENHHNVASHAVLTGETINIVDAYHDDRFDFSGTKTFDQANGYRSQSILAVPLMPMGGEVLGCLQLLNAKNPEGPGIVAFTDDMEQFVRALAASAATAIFNKQLRDELVELFDAIIDVINKAIGRKSAYTGGHCERVPVIALELAKITSAVEEGPLAGFHLSPDELKEFELAAKLHDLGKVTTPEYVVDKSTKLETIYNRVHEVRTRFEVLYRDAVIRRHEDVLAKRKKPAEADADLEEFRKVLADEWAFVAASNVGGEFLSPDKAQRLSQIASRPWLRYFDDRLGLSWEEESRLKGAAPVPVPAPETLLADKPIHRYPRLKPFTEEYTVRDPAGAVVASYQFKTPAPELLYNHGELYNLSVSRGTLTGEEHFKIKEHVMQSILMLDLLPWPRGQKRVPVIAGEHHETLVGSGYPYQKSAAELSIQSRILTVADIFEALTAGDRPYKKPKTLSEAVRVFHGFKKDRHIDADLFDLFLTSGLHLWYAERYLLPEQRDEVDIAPYLGPVV